MACQWLPGNDEPLALEGDSRNTGDKAAPLRRGFCLKRKSVTDWVEFIRLIASRGRWLVTVVIVAAIVFAIFQFSQISIDTPYVYLVYVIYLAGITCGVFLLTGMAIWVGQRIWTNLESRAEARSFELEHYRI